MAASPLRRYHHGGECWALVTGATNGMGEEYAYQLADLGFHIILHGRSASKLSAAAERITERTPTALVRTVAIDAGTNPPDLRKLAKIVEDVRLTVAVNNVGVVTQEYPLLEEQDGADIATQITVNTLFPTMVAAAVLPALKRNEPSLLINMASLGAWAPAPYLAPYSGAKAYVLSFSRALYNEMHCEKREVDVVCMVPGQVVSGMNEGPPTMMMPLAEAWVRKALASLAPGLFSKRPAPVVVPYSAHAWGARAMGIMTRSMNDAATCGVTVDLRNKKLASKLKKAASVREAASTTELSKDATTTEGASAASSHLAKAEDTTA